MDNIHWFSNYLSEIEREFSKKNNVKATEVVYPIFNLIVIRTRKFATFKNLGQNVPE